jgi:hypothetical protein
VDFGLASVRRAARRLATVAVVLYASTGVLATAGACLPGPHRHHGVPVPDCVMHHQGGHHGDGSGGHHGSAHGTDPHAHHAAEPAAPMSAMTCACGEELRSLHPADAAVPLPSAAFTPTLIVSDADASSDPRLPTIDPRSCSPPPRG